MGNYALSAACMLTRWPVSHAQEYKTVLSDKFALHDRVSALETELVAARMRARSGACMHGRARGGHLRC
jgi:hypothetical protein